MMDTVRSTPSAVVLRPLVSRVALFDVVDDAHDADGGGDATGSHAVATLEHSKEELSLWHKRLKVVDWATSSVSYVMKVWGHAKACPRLRARVTIPRSCTAA